MGVKPTFENIEPQIAVCYHEGNTVRLQKADSTTFEPLKIPITAFLNRSQRLDKYPFPQPYWMDSPSSEHVLLFLYLFDGLGN